MRSNSIRLGVIGAGNMGEAILRGYLTSGYASGEKTAVFDPDIDKCRTLERDLGVEVAESLASLIDGSDLLLIAVKPNVCTQLFAEQFEFFANKAVVSIAAGWGGERLRNALPATARVLRVMPNTPAMIGEGMIVFESGDSLTAEERAFTETLFGSVGDVISVEPKLMDAVTAVSGSGPAYVYLFIEAMADGGVKAGLPRPVALKLAAQTVKGAAMMVSETGVHPGELKDRVCSPGGTTIEAVAVLEQKGLRGAVIAAVDACRDKSEKMSK
ncbi:MAG: pyrroline-5-carboxylate reductase [Clostridiales bacterium]|nr:pyrroline-5-carboxylate reductase [Clostridiales bacterium]